MNNSRTEKLASDEPIQQSDNWAPIGHILAGAYNAALDFYKSDARQLKEAKPFMVTHLPYCVMLVDRDIQDGRVIVLNREYKPLGCGVTRAFHDYEKYPWLHMQESVIRRDNLLETTPLPIKTHLYQPGWEPWTTRRYCAEYLNRYRAAFFWWV